MGNMKQEHFFITSLPRSRTAWLSNLFTYGNSYCYHEITAKSMMEKKTMECLLEETGTKYAGSADSGILYFTEEFCAKFPSAKYVLIKRNTEEVAQCLSKQTNFSEIVIYEYMRIWLEMAEIFEKTIKPMVIPFKYLNNKQVVSKIWEYCIHDEPFNDKRFKMLNEFNIKKGQA